MITTKKFSLNKQEFLKLLLIRYWRRRWWYWSLVFGVFAFLGIYGQDWVYLNSLILLVLLIPVLLYLQFRRYVNSPKNRVFLLERYFEIDTEKITGYVEGDLSSIKWEHFYKTEFIRNHYLLHFSQGQFICMPVECFQTEADREWFENEVLAKLGK